MRTGNVILQSYNHEDPYGPRSSSCLRAPRPAPLLAAVAGRSAVMILTRRSNLSCTLLTCCGRHRGLLKRALRRMRRSCLHQLVLRLLEVDSSTTTGAEDASWLQREQQVVASSVESQLGRPCKHKAATRISSAAKGRGAYERPKIP